MGQRSNLPLEGTTTGWRAMAFATLLAASTAAFPATAAVYTVNDNADATDTNAADGVCLSTLGTCTLRAAIVQANQNPGPDVVELPAGVYSMSLGAPFEDAGHQGDFDITDSLTIAGDGIVSTVVDAQHLDRVFDIHPGTGTVTFEWMTIRHGDLAQYANPDKAEPNDVLIGGGIRALGEEVILDGVLLTRNDAGHGGGIGGDNVIEVHHSRIHQNEAVWNGGGIYTKSFDAALVFEDSVLWSNQAAHNGGGMHGIGMANYRRSSIYDNRAGARGGGFHSNTGFIPAHAWQFENVTFAKNQAGESGGGIWVAGSLYGTNLTIADNHANQYGGGFYSGAIVVDDDLVHLEHSVIANNSASVGPDCHGAIHSEGYNLLRSAAGCGFVSVPTDLPVGTNPLLGGLQFQQTHFFPLSFSSPAKDAAPSCLIEDQRGVARPQGPACDLGAAELVFDPDAPIAIDDDYDVPFPGPVSLTAPGILANDTDPNGNPLESYLQYIAPNVGAVTVHPDGRFDFIPGGFAHATRTFTYFATNGTQTSNTATVSVTSGFREPPWKVFEVPELPWLDPGPYRFDCVALWRDGTIATQTFGLGEWAMSRTSSPISRTSVKRGDPAVAFTGHLQGHAKEAYRIDALFDGRALEATVTARDGARRRVVGFENAECNALTSIPERSRQMEAMGIGR